MLAFTHLVLQHLPRDCIHSTLPLFNSMSGWMADMADLVDAAEAAAPACPLPEAPAPESTRTVSIDDAPTEPATSPRVMEAPVQQWVEELQLPTREIGPREEPERFVRSSFSTMVDGHKKSMKRCCARQHSRSTTVIGTESVVKQNYGRKKHMNGVSKNGKLKLIAEA